MTCSEEKIAGGKLVRVSVEHAGSKAKVTITGDFFIHPEDSLFLIEGLLSGLDRDVAPEIVESTLSRAVIDNGIDMIGIDEKTIARLYKVALSLESNPAQHI